MTDPLSLYNVMRRPNYEPTAFTRAVIRFLKLSDEERAAELGQLEASLGDLELDEIDVQLLDLVKQLDRLSPGAREEIAVTVSEWQLKASIRDRLEGLI